MRLNSPCQFFLSTALLTVFNVNAPHALANGLRKLLRPTVLVLLACFSLAAHAQSNEWSWVAGSSATNLPGNYGVLGTPAPGDAPGSRSNAATWTDANGNLWLFGGEGEVGILDYVFLNDFWEFSPSKNEWTWLGGSNAGYIYSSAGMPPFFPGVDGTQGVAAPANYPAGRAAPTTWTDSSGNFWMFGGFTSDLANGVEFMGLNDLWMFSPTTGEWTWMGGGNAITCPPAGTFGQCGDDPGVYGTQGTPAPGNIPGARDGAAGWTDSSGNFWLFGGQGMTWNQGGTLNDLWEYSPTTNEWTWVQGNIGGLCPTNSTSNPLSACFNVTGTPGVASAGDMPGGHYGSATWTDNGGNFWLFGGVAYGQYYYGANSESVDTQNDLWEFTSSTSEWTWWGNGPLAIQTAYNFDYGFPGLYGTLGVPAAGDWPGSRSYPANWTDSSGNLWLFGGQGYDAIDTYGFLNDLWVFAPSTGLWTWMNGSSNIPCTTVEPAYIAWCGNFNAPPSSSASAANSKSALRAAQMSPALSGTTGRSPNARMTAAAWPDKEGNLWLFAGSNGSGSFLSDTWKNVKPTAPGTPAAPSFAPLGGYFSTAPTVSLSVPTPKATIYYTLDGSAPTSTSAVYSAPLAISQTTTVNAISIAPGYGSSGVSSSTYNILLSQAITFVPPPAPIVFGTAPITLSATSTSGLAVTFKLIGGSATLKGSTLTITGAGAVVVAANQAGNTTYAAAPQATETIVVNPATPSITWATPAAITYPKAISATQLDARSSLAGAFAYTPSSGTVLTPGSETLSVTFTPANTTDYTTATTTVPLTVNQATPTVKVAPSSSNINSTLQLQVAITVSGPTGSSTPTGIVTFASGSYASAAATLNSGSATITIPAGSLAAGLDTLTANYSGDSNYLSGGGTASVTVAQVSVLTSPAPGAALTGSTVMFTWTPTTGAAGYSLWLGSAGVGSNNLYDSGATMATSVTAKGLPANGETIYARLNTIVNGAAQHVDCAYTAMTLPAITTQPASQTVPDGSSATFTMAATGTPTLAYVWQYLSGSTWKPFGAGTGSNTAALTTVATTAAFNGLQFRVVVTDGNNLTTTSNTVKLTVAPAITSQPASQTVTDGSSATFIVVASGVPTLTYQWQYLSGATWKPFGAGTGYTTPTLTTVATAPAFNGLQFRVVVTDGDGLTATSNTAVLTVQ